MSPASPHDCTWKTRAAGGGSIRVVALRGTLDWDNFHELEAHLDELIHQGIVRLVIVLRDLVHVTSVGIGCFITAQGHCRMHGGDVVFVDPGAAISEVLDLLGLLPLLEIFASEDEAVAFLSQPRA